MEKDYIFPIKTFRSFEVDPLAAITGAISELNKGREGLDTSCYKTSIKLLAR
jgi:hypothetical protein